MRNFRVAEIKPLQKRQKMQKEEDATAQPQMNQDQRSDNDSILDHSTSHRRNLAALKLHFWRSCTKCLFEKLARTRNVVRLGAVQMDELHARNYLFADVL